ncbi:hypothetical protein [Halobacillus yeomjeoni]|uniref:Uncharacterized protein n=1 Tax=Halobacillus yeomjeoni TaxID=311194 RepID=A0A931MSY7_9BACI|nr:hypothetical protein [Halobacillus yeomjeoni]MBH0228597.1 hypothetical protein [Halobacillus yeomjeoni]
MLLYVLAAVFLGFSWYLYILNVKKSGSGFLLGMIMLGIPFFYHFFGLGYAGVIKSDEKAYTSFLLALLLLLNSILIIILTASKALLRKWHHQE